MLFHIGFHLIYFISRLHPLFDLSVYICAFCVCYFYAPPKRSI